MKGVRLIKDEGLLHEVTGGKGLDATKHHEHRICDKQKSKTTGTTTGTTEATEATTATLTPIAIV